MSGRPDGRSAWSLSRADLEAGAGALPRLSHPLLPDFLAALPVPGSVRLLPDPPAPAPLPESLPEEQALPFLARLAGLCAFLRSGSLGIDPADVCRIGHAPRTPDRPALAAPPVPEFRAAPAALVVAGVAARLAGAKLPEAADRFGLRASVAQALEAGLPEPFGRIASSALRSADVSDRAEAMIWRLLPAPSPEVASDLLGLVMPVPRVAPTAAGPPVHAVGEAALLLARGAARQASFGAWVEVLPGAPLEEGAAFERAAALLGGDVRAGLLRSALRGSAPDADVPPLVVVGRELERWDPASRAAWGRLTGVPGVTRVETRLRRPAPWEAGSELTHGAGLAEISACVWLPFASLADAVAGWEAIVKAAGGEFAVVPELARLLSRSLRPGRPPRLPSRRRPAPATSAVLDAAALLPAGFDVAEVARATGGSVEETADALAEALSAGLLARRGRQSFEFTEEGERRRRAARLPAASRRDVVGRLSRSPVGSPERLAVAALARGNAEDVQQAGEELRRAEAEGDLPLAMELLGHAPGPSPDLGRPLPAARALVRAGRLEEARRILLRTSSAGRVALPPGERYEAADLLARLGEPGAALRLLEGDGSVEAALSRAEVLVEGRRDAEARALLARSPLDRPAALSRRDLLRLRLLRAELAARALDTGSAAALLSELARDLSEGAADGRLAARVAFSSGYLASDLGRSGEAKVFFRRAFEESDDPRSRADAKLDLAVVHFHEGALNEAASALSEALSFYEAAGEEGRYVSALGNRVEIALAAGRYADAREDLERVLAFDRRPGRERQLLYDIPAWQRLALLEGDVGEASRAFEEARAKVSLHPDHEAFREALVLEGRRRLLSGDPAGCVRLLEEAGGRPDNRMRNEPLRVRLSRSARIDQGEGDDPGTPRLDADEETLLAAEARLAKGGLLPASAWRLLERLLEQAPGRAAERLVEWAVRFPAAFDGERGAPLSDLGLRASGMAGLSAARAFFLRSPSAARPAARDAARPSAIVAVDPATRAALAEAGKVAGTGLSVLVLGETGTGKEALAREVHRLSGRPGRFVPVNVAALTETLLESELFGHARGAFTGAERDRAGLVEESSSGTLFLDEIGEMALPLQAKLLRVLQEREVRRLGEVRERKVDLRVVAATHQDLAARMKAGSFREDLYFRLAQVVVRLPPLRERPRDLARLLEGALGGEATLTARARSRLLSHPWPGNVRELLSAVEAAVALAAPGRTIDVGHLPPAVRGEEPAPGARTGRGRYFDGVDDARRRLVREALSETDGNRTAAARLLGLSRQSLLYEMKKLGLAEGRAEGRVTSRSRPGRIVRP